MKISFLMMRNPIISNTACHLVMGFLGAGKTSFINACTQQFKQQENWAILVNEAGQIGVDEQLFDTEHGLAIRQVSGGCICCTSQLPLQIALARLLAEHKPDRLWIEPTGLAHPKELIEQLSQPHWQTALAMKSTISIVNARQWQDSRYRHHEGYQTHVKFCDIVVVNRFNGLSANDKQALQTWITDLNPTATIIWQTAQDFDETTQLLLSNQLNQPSQVLANRQHYRQASLTSMAKPSQIPLSPISQYPQLQPETELPFRYHDVQPGYQIMGWRLPNHWSADLMALMDWLLTLPDWQRIKAVVYTSKNGTAEWQSLNFTPDSLNMASTDAQVDNRIEVIFLDDDLVLDFERLDVELTQLFDITR